MTELSIKNILNNDERMKREEAAGEQEAEQLAAAYRLVAKTKNGGTVLFDILARCGVYGVSFTGDNNDTNFREGRRSIGLEIIGQLTNETVDPYVNLLKRG